MRTPFPVQGMPLSARGPSSSSYRNINNHHNHNNGDAAVIASNLSAMYFALAQLLSAMLREFFAVGLLLVLNGRAQNFDFFNTGFVLFLILVVVRLPFINTYAFIFESLTVKSWSIKHVGVQRQEQSAYHFLHMVAIVVAHVLAGMAAASFRSVYEVLYGVESMGFQPTIQPELSVDTEALERLNGAWFAPERLARLRPLNGTRTIHLPLDASSGHGIDRTAITLWYLGEEAVYVCLLCICFVHIWLGTGVVKEKYDEQAQLPLNPFRPRYWKQLFQISALLSVIFMALGRAFPTAHGGLHVTVYKQQYQAWNPAGVRLLDAENSEVTFRILGGLLGVLVARCYNQTLVYTKEHPESTWYFSLVWGMPSPFEAERRFVAEREEVGAEYPELIGSGEAGVTNITAQLHQQTIAGAARRLLRLPDALAHDK